MQNSDSTHNIQPTISLDDLKEYTSGMLSNRWAGKDYLLLTLEPGHMNASLPPQFKIDCMSVFFCAGGQVDLQVNFSKLKITENSLLVLGPDNVIEVAPERQLMVKSYAMFLSREFLNLLSIDNNAFDFTNINIDSVEVLNLERRKAELMRRYFELLQLSSECNDGVENVYTKNIMRSFVTALIYQLMQFAAVRRSVSTESKGKMAKKSYYARDFMKLVSENFKEHRSINYYADKLFISSKYLSLVIKEATGYTATDWIDHFVTLEAKNLLRFSGRNIQQIAYDLNFNNQSSFGKYFKHQTGMSPSKFRKS